MLLKNYLKNSLALLFLLSLLSCENSKHEAKLPYYNTPDFTPLFLENPKAVTHTIGAFSFKDQDGKTITDKSVKGKIHIANFIFTSCGSICPTMTKNMMKAGKSIQNDTSVVILSYSVTPWIDTEQKLKAYKDNYGISNNNWHFLTGNKAVIYELARTSYFAEEDIGFSKDSTEFLHTEHILLIDPSMRIRGIYNGTLPLEIDQLVKDIALLKEERN